MACLQGVSPGLARDLCNRGGVSGSALPSDLDTAAWQRLHSAWTTWLDVMQSGILS